MVRYRQEKRSSKSRCVSEVIFGAIGEDFAPDVGKQEGVLPITRGASVSSWVSPTMLGVEFNVLSQDEGHGLMHEVDAFLMFTPDAGRALIQVKGMLEQDLGISFSPAFEQRGILIKLGSPVYNMPYVS